MGLDFQLLGPLRVRRDGREIDLGRPQQQAVLAALLLTPGQLVPTAVLVEGLWGEDDARWPKDPVGQIGTHAHRLRRALAEPGLLVAAAGGYRLGVRRGAVDLFRYEDGVAEATALRQRDPVRAYALLTEALGTWEGRCALDGVPGVLAERARGRLAAGRFAAVKALHDLDLGLGRHAEALPALDALAAGHPHDEEVQRLHLLALYRCGRTAEALAAYRALCERLDRTLGLEPAPAVVELAGLIRRGEVPLPPRRLPRPCQLPPDIPDLVGRAAPVREAERVLRGPGAPVLGLSGPAGSGTSALAVHVAHAVQDAFPDGQLYASGGGSGPASAGFLRALGEWPAPGAGPDELCARYRAALAGRRVLVVLDGVADPAPLLPGTPGCAAVVAGAEPGALPVDAVRLAVGPLEPHDAYELLARIAGADRIRREPDAVAEVAGLCGHLPVLLRTAATRLAARPQWSVADLVEWLARG
ncbi:BTAD domain-containing putative transcriptional regulator [Kitasatospora purpeofusca]|uniref:AfsR/SARP family transcriptional regulator n=1 Tax=Kitasatospora purpeofusca TaxID=67352 RepID=UPI002A5A7387|nr:BTAD domain-containing putative transcriptional regulator [Kitasatospora purpeofusca]MDY0811818.1 BTAD domain-containing putative transcriptional regulator [Kitasatospora purpeofusca]